MSPPSAFAFALGLIFAAADTFLPLAFAFDATFAPVGTCCAGTFALGAFLNFVRGLVLRLAGDFFLAPPAVFLFLVLVLPSLLFLHFGFLPLLPVLLPSVPRV